MKDLALLKTPGARRMNGKSIRIALCLTILFLWGVVPALAQVQYEQKEETVAPKALLEFQKGDRLAQTDKLEEAIAAYRQALRIQPKYAEAYHQIGLAYGRLNQYPEAVKAFKEAVHLRPQWGLAQENLGVAYIKMANWRDAKSVFQEEAQERAGITPSYEVLAEWGPDHAKNFKVGVFLEDELVAEGEGISKQEAQQKAAAQALRAKGWDNK